MAVPKANNAAADRLGREGPHGNAAASHTVREALALGAVCALLARGAKAGKGALVEGALALSSPALGTVVTETNPVTNAVDCTLAAADDALDQAGLDVRLHGVLCGTVDLHVRWVAAVALCHVCQRLASCIHTAYTPPS